MFPELNLVNSYWCRELRGAITLARLGRRWDRQVQRTATPLFQGEGGRALLLRHSLPRRVFVSSCSVLALATEARRIYMYIPRLVSPRLPRAHPFAPGESARFSLRGVNSYIPRRHATRQCSGVGIFTDLLVEDESIGKSPTSDVCHCDRRDNQLGDVIQFVTFHYSPVPPPECIHILCMDG